MGSDLYHAKILGQRRFVPDWRELIAYVERPEYDEWAVALGVPDELVDAIDGGEPLFEALTKRLADAGAEPTLAACRRGVFFNPELIAAIARGQPGAIEAPDDVASTQLAAASQAMLAALIPARASALELAQIDLEVATIHPDAGVPEPDPMHWKSRSFCLRLLTEADAEHYSESRLYQHFERRAPDAWAQWDYAGGLDDAMGMVWRAERLRTVDLVVDDPQFWSRVADEWWTPRLRDRLTAPSDNHPYRAVRYRVTLPAGWLRPLSEDVFDSRAY